ncbi:hypothetical protein M9H77_17792 [Catharanthus roseus]|uniref:Uncharacterized protein n=1 Tax=Catharanthus roseus TaxID=4058 RepID=A0ACC0B5L7_CATRO|nr:hypothetical protein M9H77_17792 [Catharanthus roseus]
MKTSFRPGLKFVENQVNRHISGIALVIFHYGAYKLVPRVMQMPYSAAVDLVAGWRRHRWTYREGTLIDEPSRTMSSSSSYSLREIVPERESIPVIDLSDDDKQRVEAAGQQIMELREEISWVDALFYTTRQAHRQATARTVMLEAELGSESPKHADEAVSESFQNRQFEPIREATPLPEQVTHKLNDIYDTLKYEDAMRVTLQLLDYEEWQMIGGLELPKLGHLRTNYEPGTIFKKNLKRNTYLVGFVSNERMSFSN